MTSFAFNFLPSDAADEQHPSQTTTKTTNDEGQLSETDGKAITRERQTGTLGKEFSHPFSWKEDLEAVLHERAQQEIVFQDIILSSDEREPEEDDLDCEDEYEDGNDKKASPTALPLRRVCMEQYRKEVTPGVYEGGLQVWECSLDLVRYFRQHKIRLESSSCISTRSDEKGEKPPEPTSDTPTARTCLELGCGHGLPGCFLLRDALQSYYGISQSKSAAESIVIEKESLPARRTSEEPPFQVTFVDYNDYVIDDVTLSNIVINTAGIVDATVLAQRRFVQVGSGDWKDMSRQLSKNAESIVDDVKKEENDDNRRFDFIIAAETTYTPEASRDTAELLLKHLTIDTGIGWIASKRYYFGVGGGTDALREAARHLSDSPAAQHHLCIETGQVFDNGAGNIREILKVTCHAKKTLPL